MRGAGPGAAGHDLWGRRTRGLWCAATEEEIHTVARGARLLALVLATPLVAGCSTESSGGGRGESTAPAAAPADGDLEFAVVTHGSAGDAFWDVVQNGAEA